MLRHIMIILAAAVTTLALTTAPAGAGIGNLELYSAPDYGGTHVSVPPTTVDDYLNSCVSISTLTSQGLSSGQSTRNFTSFTISLHSSATSCSLSSHIVTVNPNTSWTTISNETAQSVYVS